MAARSSPRARRATSWPIRASITGKYLSGELARSRCPPTPRKGRKKELKVVGATRQQPQECHGLGPARQVSPASPGVSGGGKSTFHRDALQGRRAPLNGRAREPRAHDRIEGLEHIDKVIDIDQSPIGRTPRSNPATYTGAFTPIRDWFAGLPEAKARGYKPGPLLVQRQGRPLRGLPGRRRHQDRDALPARRLRDLRVCKGKRYNRETLESPSRASPSPTCST
jgi:excinuclease ABC subunit A